MTEDILIYLYWFKFLRKHECLDIFHYVLFDQNMLQFIRSIAFNCVIIVSLAVGQETELFTQNLSI